MKDYLLTITMREITPKLFAESDTKTKQYQRNLKNQNKGLHFIAATGSRSIPPTFI